jgi:hypothetical protein
MQLRGERLDGGRIRLLRKNPTRFETWANRRCGHPVKLLGTHTPNKHHGVAYSSTPHASHTSMAPVPII